ncbi:MAG: hypothetical protein JNK87_09680 [Bryobacterales bacterium]|nr:hypothetical protein [Bryobacterales bacterium]
MRTCRKCGTDTMLLVHGVPLCVDCDREIEEQPCLEAVAMLSSLIEADPATPSDPPPDDR